MDESELFESRDPVGNSDVDLNDAGTENFDGEGSYICENCGEEIVIPLDPIAGHTQSYVEDCPVCCTPMVIHVSFDGARAIVWAESEQDRY
ncbi:CPXCG motif-containing cysteine-rich protein [Rhodopirellula sp. MGV]|uniref:CPXCG motif-containing cysteine-rich protein n=1 Tax=Rhodopirellula sp. MGV TaxID=2023130 RepID=UPI000B969B9F|nr:CPXCG motif-containing cysteine-rich protein [Rhodopirellula sp. MGV]OYP36673.1 hypothetical protein CGZ80_07770 [Rhodopirellula sp. MGV]PNY36104.1 CPXCG motif-containing cysteine-rich protein [Rhodopirellula baltica]